jgi:hypothetical protein
MEVVETLVVPSRLTLFLSLHYKYSFNPLPSAVWLGRMALFVTIWINVRVPTSWFI